MATVFIRHPVADFDSWRPHYDEDVDRRSEAGLVYLASDESEITTGQVLSVDSGATIV